LVKGDCKTEEVKRLITGLRNIVFALEDSTS
jgi:hypothetical protein